MSELPFNNHGEFASTASSTSSVLGRMATCCSGRAVALRR
jgi:hypothetical protein